MKINFEGNNNVNKIGIPASYFSKPEPVKSTEKVSGVSVSKPVISNNVSDILEAYADAPFDSSSVYSRNRSADRPSEKQVFGSFTEEAIFVNENNVATKNFSPAPPRRKS
jgi:hypothetical protein